jgi:hypothetical protein
MSVSSLGIGRVGSGGSVGGRGNNESSGERSDSDARRSVAQGGEVNGKVDTVCVEARNKNTVCDSKSAERR